MLFPKYALEDLSLGSGSIIGKGNIEEFFNHISVHEDVEDRSLAELAPSYEVIAAYLVHMLDARFVNLNPFMQQMFLKLHDIEDSEKKILFWRLCIENLEMLLLRQTQILELH
jgi:hypothetical protein